MGAHGVLHELVRQARLLGETARGEQIADAVRRDRGDLDVALAREPLHIEVGQTERNAERRRQAALGQILSLGDLGEDPELPQGRLVQ
jgi:hypothetical protein